MTTAQAALFRTGDTPTPDTVILTHHLTREYQMGAGSRALRYAA